MSANLVWFELPTPNTERARSFYGGLFGWEFSSFGDADYHMAGNTQPGGAITPGDGKSPVVYYSTEDIEATAAKVCELGGTAGEVQDIPGVGRMTICTDDQGTSFGIYQPGEA